MVHVNNTPLLNDHLPFTASLQCNLEWPFFLSKIAHKAEVSTQVVFTVM